MLVLSRKVGEKILIDGGIELVVLAIEGKRIRLGIQAPQDCRISRSETLTHNPPSDSSIAPRLTPVPAVADRNQRGLVADCTA